MTVELLDISISRKKTKPPSKRAEPRRFEDGSVEIELSNGRRLRQVPAVCLNCGSEKFDDPYSGGFENFRFVQSGLCKTCFKCEEAAREQAIAQEKAARMLLGETAAQRRYVAQVLATPLWRDRMEIKKIYDEAKRLSIEIGEPFEVDHIYPIQSEYACGLHVHHNLQIIPKGLNRSKKNTFPMHDSPALWEAENNPCQKGEV